MSRHVGSSLSHYIFLSFLFPPPLFLSSLSLFTLYVLPLVSFSLSSKFFPSSVFPLHQPICNHVFTLSSLFSSIFLFSQFFLLLLPPIRGHVISLSHLFFPSSFLCFFLLLPPIRSHVSFGGKDAFIASRASRGSWWGTPTHLDS